MWSSREDKRQTVQRPGLLAQLAERGADNAKVVSSSLTWTKVGERGVFLFQPVLPPLKILSLVAIF